MGGAGFSGYQPHAFELASARHEAGGVVGDLNRGEVRRVLVLEIETPGNAGRTARRIVGPCPFAQSAREILIRLPGRNGYPCLVVAGAGFKPKERGELHSFKPCPAQIVKLDKHGAVG